MAVPVLIYEAVILLTGVLRLRIARESDHEERGGNELGRWYEWKDQSAADAFRNANLLRSAKKLMIPATAVFGSDSVSEINISWEKKFRVKNRLLAHWIMES
jgi:hypothetical protein